MSRSDLALGSLGQPGREGGGVPDSTSQGYETSGSGSPRSLGLTVRPLSPPCLQEKVSQLKEEVRLQYEKLHQLLDEDLRQTVEVLDKAQAKFCSENAAQALHLGERMQEAKKLLGSLQLLFDKTEDVSFMKVGWARDRLAAPAVIPKPESAILGSPENSPGSMLTGLWSQPAWLQKPPTPLFLAL